METLPIRYTEQPSDYEREALAQIQAWKTPPQRGTMGRMVDRFNRAWHDTTELIREVPGVDWTIDNVVAGLLTLINEMTQDSIWDEAICTEYRQAGHLVAQPLDVQRLDLSAVDGCLNGLATKYGTLAAVEGGATGAAGLAGIMPDIVALVSINLRAAGEYATYCGFDLRNPHERLYALHILDVVAQPSSKARDVALTPLRTISKRVAKQQGLQALEQAATSSAIRGIARAIGLNLTRIKLAQVVPVTGAVVGCGYNAYYTNKVCDAAHHLYRERFLLHKYGPRALDF